MQHEAGGYMLEYFPGFSETVHYKILFYVQKHSSRCPSKHFPDELLVSVACFKSCPLENNGFVGNYYSNFKENTLKLGIVCGRATFCFSVSSSSVRTTSLSSHLQTRSLHRANLHFLYTVFACVKYQ